MGWQLHKMDHMQIICTSLQTDNHASTSSSFYKPDALPAVHQQHQSTALKTVGNDIQVVKVISMH